MKILALDSSSLVASVAVMTDDILTAELMMNEKKTHSQTLLPMLDQMAKWIDLDWHTIDAIAVAAGPGSFTGLRIGSATAKGLGLAWNKPLIAVPTLDAMAYNLYGCKGLVVPMMDARRDQVYTGIYQFVNGDFQILREQCALSIEELVNDINERGKDVNFLGDGVPVFKEYLEKNLIVSHQYAPAHLNRQRAGTVAVLGGIYYKRGKVETASEHKPDYLRLSQAERERLQRNM